MVVFAGVLEADWPFPNHALDKPGLRAFGNNACRPCCLGPMWHFSVALVVAWRWVGTHCGCLRQDAPRACGGWKGGPPRSPDVSSPPPPPAEKYLRGE